MYWISNYIHIALWYVIMHLCPIFNRGLTHWGRVTHICVSKLRHLWFRWWLVAFSAPSHNPNQCWYIVNWTLVSKRQWKINDNSNIFIQENAFENVICEMAAILSRPQCVNFEAVLKVRTVCHAPETCGNWQCLVNGCVCYAHQSYEIYQVLLYSVDFKAPGSFEIHWARQYAVNVVLFGINDL